MLKSSYKIITILGIPIKVHISLIVIIPFLAMQFGFSAAIRLEVCLCFSIVLHELGHSMVAIKKGCRVREILLMPIGGAAQMEQIPTKPMDEFLMAVAGPAVSFILGITGYFLGSYISSYGWSNIGNIVYTIGIINCVLVVFNLLPAFPMDGGRVFRALLAPKFGRLKATFIAMRLGRIIAVLFGIYGFFSNPTQWILVAIAFFIYTAAGNEYRMVQMQESAKQYGFNTRSPFDTCNYNDEKNDDKVIISPPPYKKGHASKTDIHISENNNFFSKFFL